MSSPDLGYHFLPWVRYGLLSRPATVDTLDATLPPRLKLSVTLRVNTTETEDITKSLPMYGPGDITGIDAREIVRTEPRHLTPDFPPHLFASIEFDRPDFPWLFTPAKATAAHRLRPWIVLAVVRKAVATITTDPNRPLPTLSCPVSELPDLRESFLWAHAVYTGALNGREVHEQLAAFPDQAISRLLCPRRLETSQGGPDAGYIACLVPAFEAGRKAGLNVPLTSTDTTTLADAWETTTDGRVELPVYFQWEFSAGPEGDFEDAVDRLQVLRDVPSLPPAMMDASRPGPGLEFPGTVVPIGSVLRPVGQTNAAVPATFGKLGDALGKALEAPLETTEAITPPIYTRWQATGPGVQDATPLASGAAPGWFSELNTDPRRRVAAALGARVVQEQQEQLVASAWEQAGDTDAVNQWLAQKQLGREVTGAVHTKRLAPLSVSSLQQITAPVPLAATPPSALRAGSGSAAGTPTALMEAVVSAPFRRMSRPLGPSLSRPAQVPSGVPRLGLRAMLQTNGMGRLLGKVMAGTLREPEIVPNMATTPAAQVVAGAPPTAPSSVLITPPSSPPTSQPSPTAARLGELDPQTTFVHEVNARLELAPELAVGRTDPLQPVMLTPTFPQPMYEPLRELFSQMLLPGVERVPNNSLMLLEVDSGFIEAYMAGLNDEMSRELLWREFPTDLRGTYFRQFWDVRGQLSPAATDTERERLRDVPPIDQWQAATLGGNIPPARGSGLLFLLIKGDLLTRFPTALIYAARARWKTDGTGPAIQMLDGAAPAYPQMRLEPAPGVTLLGFNLVRPDGVAVTADTIAGGITSADDPGWFFVLEEHPTEPRFGLDISGGTLTTWRELGWPHVATRRDGSGYIAAAERVPTLAEPASSPIAWNTNAAAMAYITLQKPFRLEVHAGYWFQRSDAQVVRQSVPATMVAGASYSASITMRNTGASTWNPGGTHPFRLGSQNPVDNVRWGSARRELTTPVAPGGEVTFAFSFIAPPPGSYVFQWRMARESVDWFGAPTPAVTITVSPAPSSSMYGRDLALGIGGGQL